VTVCMTRTHPNSADQPVQFDVDVLVPLFVGHLQYRLGAAQTRIVDHYIEPAEVFHRAADQRLDLVHVGDVAGQCVDRSQLGELGRRFFQSAVVCVADHDAAALRQTPPRPGGADTGD